MKTVSKLLTAATVTLLVAACSGGSDENTPAPAPGGKATCTTAVNWNALRKGMTSDEVVRYLGAPARTEATSTQTNMIYENCRGFIVIEGTGDTATTYTELIGGSVSWTSSQGVVAISPPEKTENRYQCELDLYNDPSGRTCRAANNPF